MLIQKDIDIQDKHSFHCPIRSAYWVDYDSVEELQQILSEANSFALPIMPIGSGCNLLFCRDYEGILLHSCIQDWQILREDDETVDVQVGAGMDWDHWVELSIQQGWSGLQNLSGIPGTVGASPVQNIGAYGVEAKDCIYEVVVLHRESLQTEVIAADACAFGYRMSRFKKDWKDKYIVCHVRFRLSKTPVYQLDYGKLKDEVEALGGASLRHIRQAVLAIRASKLPDPDKIGNAGSFFKNPCIEASLFDELQAKYPELPHWPQADGSIKISAAWLIEKAAWKGYREGDAGVCETQALVLVNHGQALGEDLLHLYEKIADDVELKFAIKLWPEVVILK